MKNVYFKLVLVVCCILYTQATLYAQAPPCPATTASLTVNSPTMSCSSPCATITATPSTNLIATTTYSVSAVTYTPYAYGAGTLATFSGSAWSSSTDDDYGDAVTLPFNFCFFGNSYNKIVIGTNGNICFNVPALVNAYDPYSISGPLPGSNCTATKNAIMGVWNDTYVGGGNIYHQTYGTAPCRQFVISWNAVDLFLPGTYCGGNHTTSEIVLYESSNIIDIYIGSRTPCAAWNGGLAVCGIENNAGSVFYCPPGENGTTFSATNLGWRFTPTGAAAGWTYNWVAPGGASAGTTSSIVVCPTTTTIYTVTATSTSCSGISVANTSTVTFTGTSTPITGTLSMCLGFNTALTNATGGGTWASGNPAVATVNSTGLVTSVSGGTSTISYTVAGCTGTVVVTVNTAPAISGTTSMCLGGGTTLSDAVTGGTWVSGNTAVATVGPTTGVVTSVGAGTSMITYTTPAGCVTTVPVSVVVLTAITGTMHACQGLTTTLADGGGGGTWSSGNTGVATIGLSSGVVTGVSGGTANITYTGGGGCYTTTTVTIYPISAITGPFTMCQNFSTTLGDAITGGTWSSSAPATASVVAATGVVTGHAGGTATISYVSPSSCVMTAVVTVNPKPAPPVPHPDTYCQFGVATAVSATGTGLLWYGPGITPAMTTAPVPSTATAGTITYYVTQTSSFGCVSDSAADLITIKPQPAPPVTTNSEYCQFSPTAILNTQVDSVAGSVLNWYSGLTGGSPLAGAPPVSSTAVTYPSGTTWYVSQTVNGCESNRAPVTVTIIYKPSFTIIPSKLWVCDHDTLSFTYNSLTPLVEGSFLWQLPPGATPVSGTTTSDPIIKVRFDSVYGPHVITLTVGELNNMCNSTDTLSVSVVPLPEAHAFMVPNICLGDTVGLAISDKSADASIFSWYIDGTPLFSSTDVNIIAANSNSGGPYSLSWKSSGIHYITITCTTNEGCTSQPTYDTVDVHALPNASFTFKPKASGTLCLEDSVLFMAGDVDYNTTYVWQPTHYFNNNNKPQIWGKVDAVKSMITLSVTDPFGCRNSSTQEIDPSLCCTILFPNAFTPNGDGKNDHFRPIYNGYHRFHSFRIVNRWGATVFESSGTDPEWDGNFNGVPQDMGVYYYYIKYDCGGTTYEEKGDCTLVR